MDRQGQRTIIASGESVRVAGARRRCLSLGLGWIVRLFLAFFVVFVVSIWADLFSNAEDYQQVIGAEPACAMSRAYCSWGGYVLAQIFPSLLGIAAIVVLALWRLPRREAILSIQALLALAYLAWSVIAVQLAT